MKIFLCRVLWIFGLAAFVACLIMSSALSTANADSNATFFIHNGDKVVFYGDSITDTEWYPTLVQTFVLTRYPQWRNEFHNRGQSGDASSNLTRCQRDVADLHPDVVTDMMGYNDGGYRPFTSAALEASLGNIRKSISMVRAANPKARVFLIAPTPNETTITTDSRWVSHEWYPYNLLMYSQGEQQVAQELDVDYVDMTTLYGQTMGLGRVMAGPTFELSRDGVHPTEAGQTFIAYHLLRAMGGTSALADLTVDASRAKVTHAEKCVVTDLHIDNGSVSFTRLCDSLPYPTPEVARPFSFLVRLDDTLNDDRLVVTGLTSPSYSISIDGVKIANLSAASLAQGVDLSHYTNTPMYEQAMLVLDAVRKKDILDCDLWRNYITTGKANGRGVPIADASRADIASAQQALTAATDACYALNTPRSHTFKLEPQTTTVALYNEAENSDLNQSFLNAVLSPIKIDWNSRLVSDGAMHIHIDNSGNGDKVGTVDWGSVPGWSITPAQCPFTVPAGKSIDVPFVISAVGQAPLDLPVATLRWHWSQNWPYPMTKTLELEELPTWTIAKSTTPTNIDGKLDDWTDASRFVVDSVDYIDSAVKGRRALWDGPDDLSATWYMKWDDTALYVAAKVRDDSHVQNETPSMMWSQDMVQVAAYTTEPGQTPGQYEFGFGCYPDSDAAITYISSPKRLDSELPLQFKGVVNDADHTCTYEIAIPWARLAPFKPTAGKSFRFTFAIGDADTQVGKGYNYLAWTSGIAFNKNPFDMATIVLGN